MFSEILEIFREIREIVFLEKRLWEESVKCESKCDQMKANAGQI